MARTPRKTGPVVVGDVVMAPLDSVRPNPWNPNEMNAFELDSLEQGFKSDGWLKSMSLTIWGLDDKGAKQNLVIDGEQRWTVGKRVGFVDGPMVFLNGLSEAQAKALTVKLDQKRGHFNRGKLVELLQELQFTLDVPDMSLDLGIDTEALMTALASDPGTLTGGEAAPPEQKRGAKELSGKTQPVSQGDAEQQAHIRMEQLFFSEVTHEEFTSLREKLGTAYGLKGSTDIVLEAMRRAASAA